MCVNTLDTVLIIVNLVCINGSHFRGGTITWRHIDNQQIDIIYKLSFRGDTSNLFCNEYDNGDLVEGEGTLDCYRGCSLTLVPLMSHYCTALSEEEGWIYGQRTLNVTLPKVLDNIYQFRYEGYNWINLEEGGLAWSLLSTANLTMREDIAKVNSPPTINIPPVIRLEYGCFYSLSLPVQDEDGDVIRCRWALTYYECDSVCKKLSYSVLNKEKCILTYNATRTTGVYAVALQIEDLSTEQARNALSSIPIQFLINVTVHNSTESCSIKPVFETLHEINTVYEIPVHITYHQTIIAKGFRISEINVTSPKEMIKSELLSYGIAIDRWYVNVTWTPAEKDIGNHAVCFTAFDSMSQASNQICITLQVKNANLCGANIDRFNTKWSLTQENKQMTLSCTGEHVGYVSRNCSSGGIWDEPDYSRLLSTLQSTEDNPNRREINKHFIISTPYNPDTNNPDVDAFEAIIRTTFGMTTISNASLELV